MFFYVPEELESDFDDALEAIGELCTINYNDVDNTTDIYAIITNLDFKSNMKGLSDKTKDIKVSLSASIKSGDYLTDSDSNIHLINWHPFKDINCYASQIQICTDTFTFENWSEAVINSSGVETTPTSGYVSIVEDVYGYINRTGMSSYDSKDGNVGIMQTQKISISVQYNSNTSLVGISDEFSYNSVQYIVTDIDYTHLNLSGTDGILVIFAQVIEGGRRNEV